MMQYSLKSSQNGIVSGWLQSCLDTPFDLIEDLKSVTLKRTDEGVIYDVGFYAYRWVDPDPMIEALLLANYGGAT